jgi:type II secretory pathway pseudopilin PulG
MHSRFNNRNFGVLEIIVSVAILAAFSVFVLRLFAAASKDEKLMLESDQANYTAVSYIEEFKGGASPFTICEELGSARPSDGYYSSKVALGETYALVEIKKENANASGALYEISVDIKRNSDKHDLCKLSGLQYFQG